MPEQTKNGIAGEAVVDEALAERGAVVAGQLVRHEPAAAGLAAAPQVSAAQLVERLEVIREAMRTAMQEDVDYGRIPGSEKPGLFKPGAEKLSVLFQLDVQPRNELIWGPGDHLTVISRATVYHAPTGTRLGYGEGICSTRERKYAYRRAERRCPQCGRASVLKSRDQGGGWFCWRRKSLWERLQSSHDGYMPEAAAAALIQAARLVPGRPVEGGASGGGDSVGVEFATFEPAGSA